MKTEKISSDEVEVVNTSTNPEKITKIRVDDGTNSSNSTNMEDLLEQMKNNAGGESNNPLLKIMGNVEEIKKIKIFFLISFIAGFWALFGWRDIMGGIAIIFGLMDITMGSKLTQNVSYVGMILGILGLMIHFKIF